MGDSDVVIRVEGLGKKYALHHEQTKQDNSFRDLIAHQAKSVGFLLNPFTVAGQIRKAQQEAARERVQSEEEFWALKDVSFEIGRGERMGIIGRNGAGKSTLLKILSRITEPTIGSVKICGRVASLLEVGTGFHPELTGRENIFLNGAILGMKRREIKAKFDEIIDFAEIEKFLDTPVKRYSSGMYVRLAFAVAAHLEPEVLIVDEVLAVGDSKFQKKCMNKLQSTGEDGKTIIFVSHDRNAVLRLCNQAVLLNKGTVSSFGPVATIIEQYLREENPAKEVKTWDLPPLPAQGAAFMSARIINNKYETCSSLLVTDSVGIEVKYSVSAKDRQVVLGLNLFNSLGDHVFSAHDTSCNSAKFKANSGEFISVALIPGNLLPDGVFIVDLAIMAYNPFEVIRYESQSLSFTLMDVFDGSGARGKYEGNFPGIARPRLDWNTKKIL